MTPRLPFLVLLALFLSTNLIAVEPPQMPSAFPVAAPAERPLQMNSNVRYAVSPDRILLTWIDSRYGIGGVFGSLYDRDGHLLRGSFPISNTWRPADRALPLWNGRDFVVLASHEYLGTFRLRVADDGTISSLGEPLQNLNYPTAAAWNGSRYGVVSQYGSAAFVTLLDASFNVVSRTDLAGVDANMSATAGDGKFLVTARSYSPSTAHALLIGEDGKPAEIILDTAATSYWASTPTAAWTGTSWIVAWSSEKELHAFVIDPRTLAARRIATPAITVPETESITNVQVNWNGSAAAISWSLSPSRVLQGFFVTSDGTALGTFEQADEATVVPHRDGFLLFSSGRTTLRRVEGSSALVAGAPFTTAFTWQFVPAIAGGSTTLLTAWSENSTLYVNRTRPDGTPLDGAGVPLAKLDSINPQISVAFAGGVFAVAWADAGGARLARFREDAPTIEPDVRLVVEKARDARVAAMGSAFFVVTSKTVTTAGYPFKQFYGAPAPLTGPLQELVPVGPQTYYDSTAVDLLPYRDGVAFGWNDLLDPPCISSRCSRRSVSHLTFFDATGMQTRDEVLATGLLAMAVSGSTLGAFTASGSPPVAALRRLTPEGWLEPLTLGTWYSFSSVVTDTANGFEILSASYAAYPSTEQLLTLTRISGNEIQTVLSLQTSFIATDAVYAFGRSWFAGTLRWKPMPEAHEGMVMRAFVATFGPKRRAAR